MKNRQLKKLCKKASEILAHQAFGALVADVDESPHDFETIVHGYWDCGQEGDCDFYDAWFTLQQHFEWSHIEYDDATMEAKYIGPKWTTRNIIRWANSCCDIERGNWE